MYPRTQTPRIIRRVGCSFCYNNKVGKMVHKLLIAFGLFLFATSTVNAQDAFCSPKEQVQKFFNQRNFVKTISAFDTNTLRPVYIYEERVSKTWFFRIIPKNQDEIHCVLGPNTELKYTPGAILGKSYSGTLLILESKPDGEWILWSIENGKKIYVTKGNNLKVLEKGE